MKHNSISFLFQEYETATSREIATACGRTVECVRRSIGKGAVFGRDGSEARKMSAPQFLGVGRRKAFDAELVEIMRRRLEEYRQKDRRCAHIACRAGMNSGRNIGRMLSKGKRT